MDEIDPFMAYMNARVRGMKSHLLTREQYEQLIEADTEDAIADRLLSSPYQHDLAESLTRYKGADAIEDAASRNLVKTYERLLSVTRGLDPGIGEIFFQRWDLIAVKSLLRAKHHGLDAQSGDSALVPGPGLGVALLHEYASLPSVEALVRALAVWNSSLCKVLVDKLPEYAQSNDLSILEDALDRNYFLKNMRLLRGNESESAQILLIAIQMEVDRINLRTVMSLRGAGSEMDEASRARLLPGGRLTEPVIEQMVQAQSPEQIIEALANTPYGEMRKGLYKFIQSNRFSQLERLFEHAFIAQLSRLSRTRGISIAILLLYTWLKFNEVINLRVIARGGAKHLPKGLVREEMMYV